MRRRGPGEVSGGGGGWREGTIFGGCGGGFVEVGLGCLMDRDQKREQLGKCEAAFLRTRYGGVKRGMTIEMG